MALGGGGGGGNNSPSAEDHDNASAYWTTPDPGDFPVGYLGFLAAPFITDGPFDRPYSGSLSAVFEGNIWKNPDVVPIAPAMLTFSYKGDYDDATGAPDPSQVPVYTFMRNSRLNLVDHDGLRLYDPFDGATLLNQTRIRH
jgi:hypothetical protein